MDMSKYMADFVAESREHMDSINKSLLSLEKDPSDKDSIEKLFRSLHTLKGNSSVMGFSNFSEFVHHLETILSGVREAKIALSPEIVDLLFRGADKISESLEKISSGLPDNLDYSDILSEVDSVLGSGSENVPPSKSATPSASKSSSKHPPSGALKSGSGKADLENAKGPVKGKPSSSSSSSAPADEGSSSPKSSAKNAVSSKRSSPAPSSSSSSGDGSSSASDDSSPEGESINSEYVKIFVSEAQEHLDSINAALLSLEKDPSDKDSVDTVFRGFHTLKGNSSVMGFSNFSEFVHRLETVLTAVRESKLSLTPELLDLLFRGADKISESLKNFSSSLSDDLDYSGILSEVDSVLGSSATDSQTKPGEPSASGKPVKKEPSPKQEAALQKAPSSGPAPDFEAEPEEPETKAANADSALVKEETKPPLSVPESISSDIKSNLQYVKVNMEKLDILLDLVGELGIYGRRLVTIEKKGKYGLLKEIALRIKLLTKDLQDEVMEVRMISIGSLFTRFQRLVRDLARQQHKKVNFEIEGEDIEFDRTILNKIGDPLVHILRNSIDHGIESPEERLSLGKPEYGSLKLIARRERDSAVVELVDDGKGIAPDDVRRSSIQKGLVAEAEIKNMSDYDIINLVFRPGVSTSKEVTNVSGRGVGMDVVAKTIQDIGGQVRLSSTVGKGTSLIMKMPLTIALVSVLLVQISKKVFALPLASIERTINLDISEVKTIRGEEIFIHFGRQIPLIRLDELLEHDFSEYNSKMSVVIVSRGQEKVGIVVDSILSQQQILIKNIGELVNNVKGISGATILSDGSIALVLDIDSFLNGRLNRK